MSDALRKAYAEQAAEQSTAPQTEPRSRAQAVAAGYDPKHDQAAEKLRSLDGLNSRGRMSLGYHDGAKAAANELNNRKDA